MGCVVVRRVSQTLRFHPRHHLAYSLFSYLGDGLVVDVDEVAGRRVDLEGLVESEGGIDGLGGCLRTELLAIQMSKRPVSPSSSSCSRLIGQINLRS